MHLPAYFLVRPSALERTDPLTWEHLMVSKDHSSRCFSRCTSGPRAPKNFGPVSFSLRILPVILMPEPGPSLVPEMFLLDLTCRRCTHRRISSMAATPLMRTPVSVD